MRHIGYLHGVTGQPPQCPPFCRDDEYSYYYEQGQRILGAYSTNGNLDGQPSGLAEQAQGIAA